MTTDDNDEIWTIPIYAIHLDCLDSLNLLAKQAIAFHYIEAPPPLRRPPSSFSLTNFDFQNSTYPYPLHLIHQSYPYIHPHHQSTWKKLRPPSVNSCMLISSTSVNTLIDNLNYPTLAVFNHLLTCELLSGTRLVTMIPPYTKK